MKLKQFNINSVIFDLDGTLIDTVPDIRLALNHMLAVYGKNPIQGNEIYELIGQGAKPMLKKAFAKRNYILNEYEIEHALDCYLNYYKANPVVETKIYSGVIDGLQELKNADVKLGICTNKPSVMTHIVLEKLNLKQFFSAVVAGDDIPKRKPDAEHIFDVLKKMAVSTIGTVMVGDSEIDKHAARNANIPFIGAKYGYDADEFIDGHIINHFSELTNVLENM